MAITTPCPLIANLQIHLSLQCTSWNKRVAEFDRIRGKNLPNLLEAAYLTYCHSTKFQQPCEKDECLCLSMESRLDIRQKNSNSFDISWLNAHLRRHPVRCANEWLPLAERGRDLRRDAKVGQLHLALKNTEYDFEFWRHSDSGKQARCPLLLANGYLLNNPLGAPLENKLTLSERRMLAPLMSLCIFPMEWR